MTRYKCTLRILDNGVLRDFIMYGTVCEFNEVVRRVESQFTVVSYVIER